MSEETYDFDLVVIGGGSGGSGAAKRAAGYGAKVCIIDRGVQRDAQGKRVGAGLGGTCVNVGCVPKKIMWFAAHHRELIHGPTATASNFKVTGIDPEAVDFDWALMKKHRDAEVARLNGVYERGWKGAGITVIEGFGKLDSPHSVRVLPTAEGDEERVISARYILLVPGGIPMPLSIPGSELAITSDGFFDLETRPKKCLVIGAGYIAVEMAGILHALGSPTSLMFRGETVLRHGFDDFIVKILMQELEEHGPELLGLHTPKELIKEDDNTITVVCDRTLPDGSTEEVRHGGYDVVLAAIGRTTAVSNLGLEELGVELDSRGFIRVDEFQRTGVESILALGDVTPGFQLTPVAIAAGRRLADRLFGGEPRARLEYDKVPTVVFSHPPIGTVGLTQQQAEEKYGAENIRVRQASFKSMFYVFNAPENKVRTGMKLVLAGQEERVVGLHLIGPSSDEMLQGFAVAVKMGATRRDFEACVAIHPTIAEELVTFGGWGQTKDQKHVQLPPQLDDSAPAIPAASSGGAKPSL